VINRIESELIARERRNQALRNARNLTAAEGTLSQQPPVRETERKRKSLPPSRGERAIVSK